MHDHYVTAAEHTAWSQFLLANQRVQSRLDAELTAQCGMTLTEYEVLAHLAAGAPLWVNGARFEFAAGPIHVVVGA